MTVTNSPERATFGSRAGALVQMLGPGLISGAADDDPSSIAAYATAGARLGFGLLWTCVVALPLLVAVQVNADRVALATGRSIGELVRHRFRAGPRRLLGLLLVIHLGANVLVTAADLLAIGAGLHLLGAGPTELWSVVAGVALLVLLVSGSFETIAMVLKALCLSILSYVGVLAVIHVEWGQVALHTFVPLFPLNRNSLELLLAVLGGTLPPFVFLWQNVHRIEELRDEPEGGDEALPLRARPRSRVRGIERRSAIDIVAGMVFAVVVMFGVIVALAAAASRSGRHDVASAADAAVALRPVAGPFATYLFAVGFIAAGLLAVPVLAGAAAANLAGLLDRQWGFSRSPGEAPWFYGLVAVATIGGAVLGLVGPDPIHLLVLAATVNGMTAAPLLGLVMWLAGDKRLLGQDRAGAWLRALGWAAVALMGLASVAVVATLT